MAIQSTCDYCGTKTAKFSLKVRDENNQQSVNESITTASLEKPCLIPLCSGINASPAVANFDFSNSHHADANITYHHDFRIEKTGIAAEDWTTLPTGLGNVSISTSNTYTLSDGTIATAAGTFEKFTITFDQPGTYRIVSTTTGTTAAGYVSDTMQCTTNTIVDNLAYQVQTTKQSGFQITQTGGVGFVEWGDSMTDNYDASSGATALSHTYASPGTYTVKVYGTATDILKVSAEDQQLTGTADMSKLNNLNELDLAVNSNLTQVINPTNNNATWVNYDLQSTGITSWNGVGLHTFGGNINISNTPCATFAFPTSSTAVTTMNMNGNSSASTVLNLSTMTGLGGAVNLNTSAYTGITFPTSSQAFTRLDFSQNSALAGTVDVSTLSNLGGIFHAYFNPLTTGLTLPTNSNTFSQFWTNNSGYTSLDLSTLTGLGGDLRGHDCSALTSLTFPTTSQSITRLDYSSNPVLAGIIDLSTLSNMSGLIFLDGNTIATGITFPSSASTFNQIYTHTSGYTSLDFSPLTGFGDDMRGYSCPNLTSVTFPTSSRTILTFRYESCNLTGTVDISGLSGLGGNMRMSSNPNLTGLTTGSSSNVFTDMLINDCDLTGTINLSGYTGLGGDVRFHNNTNLTGVTFPSSSTTFDSLYLYGCGLTGTLDLSSLTGLGSDVRLYTNTSLTGITFPTTSNVFTNLWAYSCDLTGTLDLSTLTALGGDIQLDNNSSLSAITTPTSATSTTRFTYANCVVTGVTDFTNMTFSASPLISVESNGKAVAVVNEMLVDLDSLLGAGSGTLTFTGNAAPDTTSGGFNGSAAKTSLQGKGHTVNTA